MGLVFLPAYVHVNIYFERHRALATGMAVSGCGLGTFAVATLLDVLLKVYSLQITLLIEAALLGACFIACAGFRPLPGANVHALTTSGSATCKEVANSEKHVSRMSLA